MNNVASGIKDACLEQIKETTKITCFSGFIKNFSESYNTVISDNAAILSEGQKQRLAIARTLIKKPKILILDEAMASLDSEAERIIIKNIRQYLDKSTIVVISHRLSTIMAADYAFFINSQREIIQNNDSFRNSFPTQIKTIQTLLIFYFAVNFFMRSCQSITSQAFSFSPIMPRNLA